MTRVMTQDQKAESDRLAGVILRNKVCRIEPSNYRG